MHILLTNDDGIFAPGLAALYKQLTHLGKVTVAAPSDVRSGAGHSITLSEISCEYVDIMGKFAGYSVDGSPADCVKLAVNELVGPKDKIDLVVSGMNHGANVGINVFYSGTVAGAIEAAFYDLPAIAVSAAMDDPQDFDRAAAYAFQVLRQLADLSTGSVVNLNIPQLSKGAPKGVLVVPQSTSGFDESYRSRDNGGQPFYQLTGGSHRDDRNGRWTDTLALDAGYITLTALHNDLTDRIANELLSAMELRLEDKKEGASDDPRL
jgi:5'-nucleotidase